MAVTQGLGDGYALYNGVKLPNIESVWTEELKAEKPYAFIYYGFASGSEYWLMVTDVPATIITNSQLQIGYTSQEYVYRDGKWTLINSGKVARSVYVDATTKPYITWVSQDIAKSDSTVLFPATSPIPLDGMQVIEWDGDTTGLVSTTTPYAYKISDIVLNKTEMTNAVFCLTDGTTLNAGVLGENSSVTEGNGYIAANWIWSVSQANATQGGLTFPETGLYAANVLGVYIPLLAYTPAAEPETPKWQFNLRDFLSGMAAAAASRGVLRRTPIAYLYNGVQLPGLPEVEGYEYKVVLSQNADGTGICSLVFMRTGKSFSSGAWWLTSGESYTTYILSDGRWVSIVGVSGYPIWANYDILNEDGSVHLAASDPVPVYE